MCKKSLLFLLLMAMFAPWAANAQTTVEIGDGTSAGYYNPIGTYYNYSITEQLYTADEIGMSGTISSVSFYWAYTTAKEFNITMYMANVDAENLSTGISLAEADEVFTGTLSVPATAGWVTITLDTPFAYDGTSNLLIGFNKTGGSTWFSGNTWQYTSTSETGYMARYTQNDNNVYTTSTVPGSTSYSRPNIQMVITAGGGPVCEKPATMEASNVTTNSAVLTWTGGSGTYNVEYMGGSVTEWTSYLTNTTATSANLSGLTPGTNYQYRVQSVCTDGVSGWKSVSFSTMFGIPLVEGFGTTIPTGWAQYTGNLDDVIAGEAQLTTSTYAWSFGPGYNNVFDDHARCNIYGTGCYKWLVLPTLAMENNVQLMFDLALTVYTTGSNASPTPGAQADDKFIVLIQTNNGWEVLRQWDNAGSQYVYDNISNTGQIVTIDLSSYAGQDIAIAFYGESTVTGGDNNLHIDNVSIDYIPACAKPTNLAVNYENGTTATVTWEGNAAGYELDVNGTTYTTTNNTYSLTSLELATTYEVKVRANCGTDGYSDWSNTVSFKTDNCMPEDMCALTFSVTDSYGDGWNGASIDIYDYTGETLGDLLATVANEDLDGTTGEETQTITLNFCNGQELAIIWMEGGYDDECSYTITDLNGDIVAQDDVELAMAYTMNCTVTDCRRPTNLAVSEIGGHSVKLSWTENGPATEWVIEYISENDEETTSITVNTNPYTLTGLTPETMYAAQVTPVCEVEKPSEIVYWTTDVACPKPSDLTVTPYPTTAEMTWTGWGEGYTVEWAEHVPYTPSGNALWLQYDDDTYVTSIGNSSARTWTWGVMYPASMFEGNTYLNKVGIYENSYYTMDSYTVNIYTGGDDAPETLVGTQTVIPTANGMHEINLAEPVTIDPTQNLWITVTGYGTYILNSCETTEPNNQWVLNSGTWANIGDLSSSLAGYGWMIRGFIDNIAPSYDWNTISGVASPYTITGLEAETDYIVRVKADCGQDGLSGWTYATFTTPSACDVPVDLEATDITYNAATLNWVGYQNSYNLRWWSPAHVLEFNANDFTQVGEDYIADSVMQTYTISLSGFSGVGNVAIRHYNISDMFRLNIDDIVLTNAQGEVIASEDFESGEISMNWVNYDLDGDGYTWDIWNITQQDANGNDVGNGSYCATSASYNSSGALNPDNWLVIPNVELGGTLTFVARGQDPAWPAEVFGVFVSTNQLVVPGTEPVTVNNVTMPYELTGLNPETPYAWQVQGINANCADGIEWSEIATFTTPEQTNATQTIALVAGKNWISFNVETNLDDLKAALVEAVPGTAIKIQGKSASTTYNPSTGKWRGQLSALDLTQMCKVEVTEACEITLEGMPIDPAAYPITINANAATWIAFPLNESMTVANAFNGFAKNGDQVKAKVGSTTYNETTGKWRGSLSSLQPGMGYVYISNWSEPRTFTFPASAKAAPKATPKATQTPKMMDQSMFKPRTVDIDL